MILDYAHKHAFVCLMVICTILSLVIASCSTTDRSSRAQAPGSALGYVPAAAVSDVSPGGVPKGKELYDTLACAGCHVINGQGGKIGPDLSNEANKGRSRAWLATKIRNPKADNPQTLMPANTSLSDEQVGYLADYLLSLTTTGTQAGAAAAYIAPGRTTATTVSSSIGTGATRWSQRCGQCHNLRPASQYDDAQWAAAMHHMRVRVPLTGQEQRDILAFLQASN